MPALKHEPRLRGVIDARGLLDVAVLDPPLAEHLGAAGRCKPAALKAFNRLADLQIPVLHRTVLTDHGLPRLGHGPVAGIGIGVDKFAAVQARDLGDKQIILRQILASVDADHWLVLINMILGVVVVALGVTDGGRRHIFAVDGDVDFRLELGNLRLNACKRLRLPVQRRKRGLLRREL